MPLSMHVRNYVLVCGHIYTAGIVQYAALIMTEATIRVRRQTQTIDDLLDAVSFRMRMCYMERG